MIAQNDYNKADLDFLKSQLGITQDDIKNVTEEVKSNLDIESIVSDIVKNAIARAAKPYINDVGLGGKTLISWSESEEALQASGYGHAWMEETTLNETMGNSTSTKFTLKAGRAYKFKVNLNSITLHVICPVIKHSLGAISRDLDVYCTNLNYMTSVTQKFDIIIVNRGTEDYRNFKLDDYIQLRCLGLN